MSALLKSIAAAVLLATALHPVSAETTPSVVSETTTVQLTKRQKRGLRFMYQEEKLARDIYIELGEMWNHRTFLNIQKSEQTHMTLVKRLLRKYHIALPVDEDELGVFANRELQALYDELLEQGSESLEAALRIGVLIEETDIDDLKEYRKGSPADIRRVYNRLLRGSYRHLDAFNRALSGDGGKGRGGRNRR